MAKKTNGKGVSAGKVAAIGAGVAAVGAGAYYFLGPKGKKHRNDAKVLAKKVQKGAAKQVTKVKALAKKVAPMAKDMQAMAKDGMRMMNKMSGNAKKVVSKAKKVVKKAVKKAAPKKKR